MMLHIRDFDRSPLNTTRNDAAWRAGFNLMLSSFHETPSGSVPNDDKSMAAFACLGGDVRKWRRVKDIALRGWVLCSDDRLYHPIVAEAAHICLKSKAANKWRYDRRLEMETGEWARIRSEVFVRDDFTCQYCGKRGGRLECDHIFPRSKGGLSTLDNLQTACRPCNQSKGAKLLSEWLQ